MEHPKLTISLLMYNSAKYLPTILASLARQSLEGIELVIVDNASSDDSLSLARSLAPSAIIISLEKNIGFSGGHNVAIRNSTADYILILNPDTILGSHYCRGLVDFLDANESYGMAAGLLVSGGEEALTNEVVQGSVDSCGLAMRPGQWAVNIGAGEDVSGYLESREVWGVSGAAAIYRRAALLDVAFKRENDTYEYFDEDFFLYQEDVDISYRLRWRGWRAYYLASAIGCHDRTRSGFLKRENSNINFWSYRNHWYVLIKNVSGGILLRWWLFIAGFELAKLGYLVLFERSTIKGLGEVRRMWGAMMVKRALIMQSRKVSNSEMNKSF